MVNLCILLLAAALTAGPSAAQVAPSTPAAEVFDDRTEHELHGEELTALAESIAQREAQIAELRALLQRTAEQGRREQIERQIATRDTDLYRLHELFREMSSGIDLEQFAGPAKDEINWSSELKELLGPLIAEVKRATGRPRKMHRLEREIESLRERIALSEEALSNLQRLKADRPSLNTRLAEVEGFWANAAEQLRGDLVVAEQDLHRLRNDGGSLYGTVEHVSQVFFRSRGRNLLLAMFAFVGSWVVLRLGYVGIRRVSPFHRRGRTVGVRLFDLVYMAAAVLTATLIMLLVLYAAGDWLLLSIASLFLFGLAWASKTALPRFWRQAMLLLNLGPVREDERVLYEGLPYRVQSLGFHTYLANPDLAGGQLRIPLQVTESLVSRPSQKDEPWFPTRRGDWVLLDNGKHAHVTIQTPEIVTAVELGGARRNFRTEDFFRQPPTVLSTGFRLWATFGVDYQHQEIATTEIPATFRQRLREALEEHGHHVHLRNLDVEFKEAGASSLDVVALADFAGTAAPDYQRLNRLLQRTCVDACTEKGWVIPFTQVTLHVAPKTEVK